jgi:hypothetical protein
MVRGATPTTLVSLSEAILNYVTINTSPQQFGARAYTTVRFRRASYAGSVGCP